MSYSHAVLNLRQLQCFVEALEAGTMTAAAERLRISQSAVSLAITGLEDALGTQLLIRSRAYGLAPTDAGRRLLPQARELLTRADEIRDEAAAHGRELDGRLVFGCYGAAAPFVLPGLLETFKTLHPAIELDLVEGGSSADVQRALLQGRCELALIYDRDLRPGIVCEPLYRTAPYAALAPDHPLAAAEEIWLRDLASHDLVMIDNPPSRSYFDVVFAHAGVSPRIRFVVSNYELLRSLVARNLGYGLLTSRPAGDMSYEGRPIVARRLADDLPYENVGLGWVTGARRSRRATAFAEHCRRMVPDHLGQGVGTSLPTERVTS